jgi:NADH dehydrogenase
MNGKIDTSTARAPTPLVVAPRLAAGDGGEAHAAHVASSPRVVIVGAGFGGLTVVQALRRAPVEVTVIDRQNHHLFQPLLYQIATAGLSPADIAVPIRSILRKQRNVKTLLGEVTGIDKKGRCVLVGDRRIPYDLLVIATGATHAYFGHDEWAPFAPGLKSLEHALALRRRILLAFEKAETSDDPLERRRLGNFVIIGGGPTGVELSGAIAELAKNALATDFRNIDPRHARIILVEAGPRLLTVFPEALSAHAKAALERLGVEVRLGAPVTSCDERGVSVGPVRIEAETIIWAAGVAASPAAAWLAADRDRAGRVVVTSDFLLPGHPEIFVIGDTAAAKDRDGKPLPGVAPVAKEAARHVAKTILARMAGRQPPSPFRYKNPGNLATIGRRSAIVDFGWLRMTGFPAWLLWSTAHIYFLIGFRNRLVVALDWLISYFTSRRRARLITGG